MRRLFVDGPGNVVLNASSAALAQNFTDGATYIPRCLTGAPSGVPTSFTGAAALVVGGDSHLYAELASGSFTKLLDSTAITLTTAAQPNVTSLGTLTGLTLGAANALIWSGRSQITSPADSQLLVQNNAGNAFSRIMFGGTTSSSPALRVTSATLDCVLADASAYAGFNALNYTFSAGTKLSNPIATDGILLVSNNAASAFTRLQFGTTTSSSPALRVASTGLDCVLADNSAYAPYAALSYSLGGASKISGATDGIILLSNNAASAFTRLQFGGTGNTTPGLRTTGSGLDCVTSDATGYSPFGASSFNMGGTTFLSNISSGVLGIGTSVGSTAGSLQVSGTASTHGELLKIESASELLTLSTGGTTTDTTANLLPVGAVILAVDCRVTTTITTATNWSVGDATTAARFSAANSTLTSGTTSVGLEQFGGSGAAGAKQNAAAKVRITTTGTPGAGAIRITVHYIQLTAPTS